MTDEIVDELEPVKEEDEFTPEKEAEKVLGAGVVEEKEKPVKKKPKRSFVSEKDLEEMEKAENPQKEPDALTIFMMMTKLLYNIDRRLQRLLEIFEGIEKTEEKKEKPKEQKKVDEVKEVEEQLPSEEVISRVREIQKAFEKYSDLITIDAESSAQYIKIMPKRYLAGKFNEIRELVVKYGGRYVSQGKQSHFLVPKVQAKKQNAPSKPKSQPKTQEKPNVNLPKMLQGKIPNDLASLLRFEETNDAILVFPQKYLGAENFTKIATIIRQLNGEYVSAGKESHFRIPKA